GVSVVGVLNEVTFCGCFGGCFHGPRPPRSSICLAWPEYDDSPLPQGPRAVGSGILAGTQTRSTGVSCGVLALPNIVGTGPQPWWWVVVIPSQAVRVRLVLTQERAVGVPSLVDAHRDRAPRMWGGVSRSDQPLWDHGEGDVLAVRAEAHVNGGRFACVYVMTVPRSPDGSGVEHLVWNLGVGVEVES